MKKTIVLLLIIPVLIVSFSCRMNDPSPKPPTLVTIGDSITMGIQDAGLHEDFQHHTYGYLIARQMGDTKYFQQPYVSNPGIGVPPYKYPFELADGSISAEYWPSDILDDPEIFQVELQNEIFPLLSNTDFLLPYNNLGINGARLEDIDAESAAGSAGGNNFFFDIVLRTQFLTFLADTNAISQAARLDPDYLIFWIGNNDILHVVLDGAGTDGSGFESSADDPPTDTDDFSTLFEARLLELLAITPNIITVSIPSYLPFVSTLDGIFMGDPAVPCVFDPTSFEPIDFDDTAGELYIPLLLEETGAAHVLLSGAIEYLHLDDPDGAGLGIPDMDDLTTDYGSTAATEYYAIMVGTYGLSPSGEPLGGAYTLTAAEETSAQGYITSYNTIIQNLCTTHGVTLLDISADWWDEDGAPDGEDYSGLHALQAEGTTTFSLDGVHPNNLGHALIARALIDVLNNEYALGITQIDPADYAGQYTGTNIRAESLKALRRVKEF